jgi:diaminopimelate decarboxylase
MSDRPIHAPLQQFPVVDDALVVGGMTIAQLVTQVGQTPFYAYDREAMTRRMGALREALPNGVSIHYALKANPMPAVVDHLASLADGLDVASLGELKIALDSGTDAAEISFAGPGKDSLELRAAIASGITLNLESAGELQRIVRIGDELGITPRVAVRVNPDFELKSSGMKMSGGAKPFGIDAEQVPAVLGQIGESSVHFRGFQIFSGSQNLRPDRLAEAQNATFDLAYRLAEAAPSAIETLNIGGGFGIPYFPGDRHLDLGAVGENLALRLEECRQRLGETEVVIELGRYLVGEAGVYVCEVIDKKISRGVTYLVTNGGLHQHLAASGNFGQIVRKNFPVLAAHRVTGLPRETVNVVGRLCTPLDLLGERIEIGVAEPGDHIVIMQSGAYGFSSSPQRFLSHPAPLEILV